ncbi:hypothetical protein TIFTF001_020088 [Ficus carica]|uniref:Reverse transcriptase zinc-binding domain-containing protein n=1 Tax=Ficus carica TaxID=3494 RepID=A0AA88AER3_FICCA|nr:hypothetical protein TIFTF001_020088 [Ficus carica]
MIDNSLACDFMRKRYVPNERQPKVGPAMSSIWGAIRNHYVMLQEECTWIVGEQSKLNFWKDNWIGYPIVSQIQIPNNIPLESKVVDFFVDNKCVLPNTFWQSFPCIAADIEEVTIAEGSTDVVRWRHCSEGIPKTSNFYDHTRPRRATVNWGEKIWRSLIQPRRSMAAWKAIHGCLVTENFLHKKGFYLPSCCHFCLATEEDKDHIFVGCDFTRTIWTKLESTFHARLIKTGIQQLILSTLNCNMSKRVYNLWIAGKPIQWIRAP